MRVPGRPGRAGRIGRLDARGAPGDGTVIAMTLRTSASRAADHPVLEKGARLGYAANGVLNLLIGWLALQVAWAGGGQEASAGGALETLAATPVGGVLLWVLLVGFVLLGLWQLATAAVGGDTMDRVKAAGKGVGYLVLAGLTFTTVNGSGGSDDASSWTARVMEQPLGRVVVALVGLGIVAVGAYHVHKGWTETFLRDLEEHPGTWVRRAGKAGYVARGVALGIVGALVVVAAATADPEQAKGLDGALQTLREAPLGQVALTLVALGFVAYGVYGLGRARYARV